MRSNTPRPNAYPNFVDVAANATASQQNQQDLVRRKRMVIDENRSLGAEAASWATTFVLHQTRRMLYMANSHANETEFALRCQKVIDMLTKWSEQYGDLWMPSRDISRKLRWTRHDHEDIRNALIDQARIETDSIVTGGRPKAVYRLRSSK